MDKLKALRLPPLVGKSFLDVGCNEGFFCGFAKFDGANRVVGIDRNKDSVARASSRFPDVEFNQRSWDEEIEGQFDLVLLASALHYAKDQKALIQKLMNHVTQLGTLVLELGVSSEGGNKWVTVKRSIDERQFPTRAKLEEILEPHAWKIMGYSVTQQGDPVSRLVVHVQHRRPYAFLLLSPSGYGKTTIAKLLTDAKDLQVVFGDNLLSQINRKKHPVNPLFQSIVEHDFSSTTLSKTINRIFESGHGSDWVNAWLTQADGRNVVIDSYVPEERQAEVIDLVSAAGYIPIMLSWDQISNPQRPNADGHSIFDEFHLALEQNASENPAGNTLGAKVRSMLQRKVNVVSTPEQARLELPADFEPSRYLEKYPDVRASGMDPGIHYLNHGRHEGRSYR